MTLLRSPDHNDFVVEECCDEMRLQIRTGAGSNANDFFLANSGKVVAQVSRERFDYCPFCGVKFNILQFERPAYT